MKRPMKTVFAPWRLKKARARASLASFSPTLLPYRRISAIPPFRPRRNAEALDAGQQEQKDVAVRGHAQRGKVAGDEWCARNDPDRFPRQW
jgi:hypothetical protein